MSAPATGEGGGKAPASRRIIEATRTLIARGGAAEVSIGDVAAEAGVSKPLIHYHFRDKETLLRALMEDLEVGVMTRSRELFRRSSDAGHVLDEYWSWVDRELRIGDLRILISLADCDSETLRAVARRIAAQRRESTAGHVAHVFEQLGLRPRVPTALVADTLLAFVDGLATAHALSPARDPRPAFDVLWLALLTLAE